jgi:hypothetical protein
MMSSSCRCSGLTRTEIERAREQEDIWQFVMRGTIRMADFRSTYTVYLYDLWQAEALASMLRDEGISASVTVEPVAEAGILDVVRPKPDRSRAPRRLHQTNRSRSGKRSAGRLTGRETAPA